MMRGLFQLTWLEIKIFAREPLGAIGTLLMPVAVFLLVGRAMNRGGGALRAPGGAEFLESGLPVMAAVFMAISAVISLVTIISIYREGGILKRLRATPLRPYTILSAHVLVEPGADCHRIRLELERMLTERFGLEHATLQVEHVGTASGLEIRRTTA